MPSAMGLFVEVVSDLLPMLDMEDSLIKVCVTGVYSLIKVYVTDLYSLIKVFVELAPFRNI